MLWVLIRSINEHHNRFSWRNKKNDSIFQLKKKCLIWGLIVPPRYHIYPIKIFEQALANIVDLYKLLLKEKKPYLAE